MKNIFEAVLLMTAVAACATPPVNQDKALPNGFVYLSDVDSTIIQDMRYTGDHNFIGKPIRGYLAPKCILTKEAATALANVQNELKQYSLPGVIHIGDPIG